VGELVDDAGQDASDSGAGVVNVASRYLRPVHRLKISYRLLPRADRVTLERWIIEQACGGVKCFEVTDPTTAWLWRCRFDPAGTRKWSTNADHPDKHDFSADLIEDPEDKYLPEIYA
jgi:hypothetical protein